MAKAKPLILSPEERYQLETIIRTRTLQAQVVSRVRILLLKGNGDSVDSIAEKVDLNRNNILLCLKKFKAGDVTRYLMPLVMGKTPKSRKKEIHGLSILHVRNQLI